MFAIIRKECFLRITINIEDEKHCHVSCSYLHPLGHGFGCCLNRANEGIIALDESDVGCLRTTFCQNLKEVEIDA